MKTLHLRPRLLRDRRASVATVKTELVARAPSQLRRPRGSSFRPRACLCASIAIFRIARASLDPRSQRSNARWILILGHQVGRVIKFRPRSLRHYMKIRKTIT
eukprot:scaffold99560_cov102-Phaeocystis_antarctica.AAC.3